MALHVAEWIQVAGVMDAGEADLLCRCGVPLLGFPLRLPVNAVDLPEAEAGAIIRSLRAPHHGVLITYLDEADAILAFCRELGAPIVQLHGPVATTELARLREAAPELGIIKSLVVGRFAERELHRIAHEAAPFVDAFITDSFDPASGAEGATGRTHDWAVSRRLAEASPRPLILAGGLTPDNVAEAIAAVHPTGVDAHTGLEGTDGRKDEGRVRRFLAEARQALSEVRP